MARLPEKLVQAPAFDSPLRRTVDPPRITVAEPIATSQERDSKETLEAESVLNEAEPEELSYRVTVRLSQRQWEAVQTECCRLRILGQKVNASAFVRAVVDDWIADH